MEEEYKEFLRNQIKDLTRDGYIDVLYDYEDLKIATEMLKNIIENNVESSNIKEELLLEIEDTYADGGTMPDDQLMAQINEKLNQIENVELQEYVEDNNKDIYSDLLELGYKGINWNIDELLESIELKTDILVTTPNEDNYDLSSIINSFGSDYLAPDLKNLDTTDLDNGITFLLHQQGHKVLELYEAIYSDVSKGKLVDSIAEEVVNNPAESTCALTIVANLTGKQVIDIIENKNLSIEFPTDTVLGIYNGWIGGGSVFKIKLEKPFIVPIKMIRLGGYGNYTVEDCYGEMETSESNIKITNTSVELVREDLEDTLKKAINIVNEHAE